MGLKTAVSKLLAYVCNSLIADCQLAFLVPFPLR
jgi:hypothetical protein